ncbi:MAG: dihydroneopterin aldolase [Oleiphilaceae bacterium]|nr:dihydroneopterin aldolase [Oleiphilaceae bacterium]
MQDKIFIEGLMLDASVGIFDWEKQKKQPLVIDCVLDVDLRRAALSNDIVDTISYAEVAQRIEALVTEQHHDLVEYLAERIISDIFEAFEVSKIKLKLAKPEAVASAHRVGIILERTRP